MSDRTRAAAAAPLRRLLVRLVSFVCDHPRLVLVVAATLCAVSGAAAAGRLRYHTSRNDLISAGKDCQRRWHNYLAEFGDDDDIVVVVQGGDRRRMKQALDEVAAALAERADLFDRLFYKVDLRHLRDRALLLAPAEQVRAIHDDYLGELRRLLDAGPLGWHLLGVHSMVQEARVRVARIPPSQKPSAADERLLAQLARVALTARDGLTDPDRYRSPWTGAPGGDGSPDLLAEPHYFFSADGVLAFLLVRPRKEAGSFTAALASVRAARAAAAEVQARHPSLRIGLTGMPVLETDEMVAAERDTRLASYLAVGGVTLLFFLVYRGVWYPLLTVLTLLVGTAWAFGWLTLTVGHLNILSATFAVMLIGMGDYGVLWVMRYEHARRQGMDVRAALLHTASHVAVGNLTAAATLALAFFAALFADFKAVAELGWIAGCGVLLCAFACFTVLPALLLLFDRRGDVGRPAEILPHPALREDRWLPQLTRRPGAVLGGGLALIAVAAVGAWQVRYDHNLLHLQAGGLESVQWEMTLIRHTAGASWHALSSRRSGAEAIALRDRFRQLPEVSQVIEVASLVPPDQAEKLPLIAAIHRSLAHLPRRGAAIAHAAPDVGVLLDDLAALVDELDDLDAHARGQGPFAAARDAARALLQGLEKVPARLAGPRLQRFDERLAADLAENLHRLRDVATPRPIEVADLPPALRERYVGRSGSWLLRVFARDDLWEHAPLENFTKKVREVDDEATGKPFTTAEGLEAMQHGLFRAGVYAFGVIVLVLWLDFRRLGETLLAVVPLLLGVLLSVGVLGLLGWPLNPANMIAFPLILGVGVDNGVHVLHDYLIRRREGRPGVSAAIGRGVLVKALTTMIGFAALMISTERGLVGLGFILTLGVGGSMLAALVLLPALLELLGRAAAAVPPRQEGRRAA